MKNSSKNADEQFALLLKVSEQVAALEKKIDLLIAQKAPSQDKSSILSVPGNSNQGSQHKVRPLYQATCADCHKECELPFRPSGDRPVYCKECFRLRKARPAEGRTPRPELPSLTAPVSAVIDIPKAPSKEKKKPASSKKPVARKKTATKKKSR